MEEETVVEVDNLSDMDLIQLYEDILEHIKFLNDNILSLESEGNNNE